MRVFPGSIGRGVPEGQERRVDSDAKVFALQYGLTSLGVEKMVAVPGMRQDTIGSLDFRARF